MYVLRCLKFWGATTGWFPTHRADGADSDGKRAEVCHELVMRMSSLRKLFYLAGTTTGESCMRYAV